MQIKAALLNKDSKNFVVKQVDIDPPKANEVLVNIVATGMCHTDLAVRDGHIPFPQTPCILGHEGSGIVSAVGEGVTRVKPGDHVALSFAACGACDKCLSGEVAYCRQFFALNFGGKRSDGSCTHHDAGDDVHGCFFGQSSFASHALVHERNLVPLPKDLSLDLMGPLGCGLQTGAGAVLNYLKPSADSSIAVFGVGAVGLAAIMAAKVAGCTTIIALDIHNSRLELARELGATHVINSASENPQEAINAITGGGVNFSIEATGIPAVMATAMEVLAKPGHAALLGSGKFGAKVEVDMLAFAGGNTIKALTEGDADPHTFIPQLIELYRNGQFPFDKFVTFYDLEDINQAAHDAETGVTIKPVIRMPAC